MKTAREALAAACVADYEHLPEYRYQSTRFTKAVYAVGDRYWCAARKDTVLPKPTDKNRFWEWTEKVDSFVNSYGWKIYYMDQKIEAE